MKHFIIKKQGELKAQFPAESIDAQEALNAIHHFWGKPERFVLHKDELGAEAYEDSDVIEEKVEQDSLGVERKYVKLKAEYTISIEDITEEHNLQQVIAKRKAEYPSAEEFMNAFFDGGDEALAALQAKRLEIKAKYPKN